jgi:hypothetical protein
METLPPNHIRLLHLTPGQPSEPLHITLTPVLLSSSPIYECLSYTWGTTSNQRTIYAFGAEMLVTQNLYLALQQLRQPDQIRVLWIDAICINQSNTQEQSAQVRMMRDIYKGASLVLIWLGEETPLDKLAFNLVEQFQSVFDKRGFFLFMWSDFGNGFPAQDAEEWVALINLFRRPWWLRVWVLQEAVVARTATAMCGTLRANFDSLIKVADCLGVNGSIGIYDVSDEAPGVLSARVIKSLRAWGCPLLSLLRLTRSYQATDQRDNVFALMGLISDKENLDGKGTFIDYSVGGNDLFRSLAIDYLTGRESLEYLSYAGLSSQYPYSTLSSWVADWSYPNNKICTIGANRPFRFKAAGDTTPHLRISSDRATLTIKGYTISTISRIGPFTRKAEQPTPNIGDTASYRLYQRAKIKDEKRQVADLDDITSFDFIIPEGQPREEAIWRTFACDMTPTARRLPASSVIAYQFYHSLIDAVDEEGNLNPARSADGQTALILEYLYAAKLFNTMRNLCATTAGHIGSVPHGSVVGDVIGIFQGGTVPFVLRESEDGHYQLVGECYVHGIMDGEALKCDDIKDQAREFKIR